ncbi:hypothetical protein ES705_26706 [subsurface metagenome]
MRGFSMLVILCIMTTFHFTMELYRFEGGYIEAWYQLPISQILSPEESLLTPKDTIFKKYSCRLDIYNEEKNDSAHIEGVKGAYVTALQQADYFIDYIPFYLYPGNFSYCFIIESGSCRLTYEGEIEVLSDTILFYCSDLILGSRNRKSRFVCHGCAFTPLIDQAFTNRDTLFSYLEIYGLVPDSLYYRVKYQIIDSLDETVFEKHEQRLKYAYTQIDTFRIALGDFIDGNYTYIVEVFDSALNASVSRQKRLSIRFLFDETAHMQFYRDIHYIISTHEYKKFSTLRDYEKRRYLKNFWSKNDYWQFEKRILEADDKFAIHLLKGRDSERGRFYIKNGPPDDINDMPITDWGRPLEIWYYYAQGYSVLFCDKRCDGNPVIVKIFKSGEEDIDDERWLIDIAPGTYKAGQETEEYE